MKLRLTGLGLPASLVAGALLGCGSDAAVGSGYDGGTGDGNAGKDSGFLTSHDSTVLSNGPDTGSVFTVTPGALTTITVNAGASSPTVTFKATRNGSPTPAGWSVDRPDIGGIAAGPSTSAVFTPTGTTAGLATITASAAGQTVTRQVLVKVASQQNGPSVTDAGASAESAQIPTSVSQLSAGGGVGGVGGEGLGTAASAANVTLLANAVAHPSADAGANALSLLYPYDKTVWPRGMLAPLLMWSWAPGDADAIHIDARRRRAARSRGAAPSARRRSSTQTGGQFIRSPIPQDVWNMATNTAGALAVTPARASPTRSSSS